MSQDVARAPETEAEEDDDTKPIWFKEEEQWELTWPIWHMLPREERKVLAFENGYKSIGEFEEYMSLRRAVGDSSHSEKPYDNALLYSKRKNNATKEESKTEDDSHKLPILTETDEFNEDEEEEDSSDETEETLAKQMSNGDYEEMSEEELMLVGGTILVLPEELLHLVFAWLPVDAYATLARVSPHWKFVTRTEFVYKRLCERCYLNQSKRRVLHVSRFGHSYRNMLESRPRVKAGGGAYVLKYAQIHKIERNMWTEIPVGAVLETVYYRYFYFQENGTVLYALTTSPPHEMFARFFKMMLTGDPDKAAVWGRYQVRKNQLTVTATQPWHTVKMELTIQPVAIGGRFCALSFDKHLSSASGDFDEYYSRDLVEYKVPHEMFRFIKDRRL